MNTITENLILKISEAALEGVEERIAKRNFEKEWRKSVESLLEELQDETFYNALDNYIVTDKIIDKLINYCDNYSHKNVSSKDFLDEVVSNFLNYNKSISYINLKYLKIFFTNLFSEIFKLRYHYKKNSDAEIIIANLKRELESNSTQLYSSFINMENKVDKIWSKLCKDDFTINDKRFQFLEKYNSPMFLEEDNENAIKLKEIYVPPRYREKGVIKENIRQYIDDFMFSKGEEDVLFIVGQPTVGKSSLICDLINRYAYRDDFIALQFKELDESKDLVTALKNKLQCNDNDFVNKILILDGFDEAKICKNEDINQIDKICRDFINELQTLLPSNIFFKVILTIRTDFFKLKWKDDYDNVRVIELVEFNKNQIRDFQNKYLTKRCISPKIIKFINQELNQNKVGIVSNPMMLYMICRYEEDWGHDLKKSDIYNSIFDKNGPLFSNLYKGKGRGENREYINKYYNIIGKIAFKMYTRSVLTISEQDAQKLVPEIDNNLKRFTGMAILSRDNGQSNYIEFIHSTICAYFAAKNIYCQICSIYQSDIQSENEVLKIIDALFSNRDIKGEVLEFLQYFIEKGDVCKQEEETKILLNATPFILERNCIHSLEQDSDISLLERIHNAFYGYWKVFTTIYLQINKKEVLINNLLPNDKSVWRNLGRLLKNGSFNKIYLRGADFRGVDLRCAILRGADMSFSNLSNADMRGASLVDVKLCNSILNNANFNGADMCKANLRGASLKGLKVRGSVLKECKFINSKNVDGVKFSYSNVCFIQNIKEEDLEKCFVYDKSGRMKHFKEYMNKTGDLK